MNLQNLEIKTNIVSRFFENANLHPNKLAVRFNQDNSLSYKELYSKVQNARIHLRQQGLKKGEKALLLVGNTKKTLIIFTALCAEGITVVLVDPILGIRNILRCIKHSQARFVISSNNFFRLQFLSWSLFKAKKIPADLFLNNLEEVLFDPPIEMLNNEPIFLSYTSGSTGTPKCVPRDHLTLSHQQIYALKYLPKLDPDIHLCGYTISAMQNLIEGSTTVLPQGSIDNNLEIIKEQQVTRLSGPPGWIDDLVQNALLQKKIFLSVKSVLLGGAPIQNWLIKNIQTVFPQSQITIIYGSTECEPIAFHTIQQGEQNSCSGYLLGLPIQEIEVKLFDKTLLDKNSFIETDIGEICLCGNNVVKYYFNSEKDQGKTKCTDSQGKIWHRTGDIGQFDHDGRLWLLGRYSQSSLVYPKKIYNGILESHIEQIPGIRRAALVFKNDNPHIVIEGVDDSLPHKDLIKETLEKLKLSDVGFTISSEKLPVDPRHRWKIQRNKIDLGT